MIVTVTMNPAMDKTASVGVLIPGGLNRLENVVLDAGGKGINVSKMICALGGDSFATGFLGGGSGNEIERLLKKQGINTDFVTTANPTRTNLKVLSEAFGITEFNEPGAAVSAAELDELKKKLASYASPETIFVFAGSLPPGMDTDITASLIAMVKENGASVFLDADGEAFRAALSAKPDFIKPNKFELAQYFGKDSDISLSECRELCRRLVAQGVTTVVLSMGAEGAMFVTVDETLFAPGIAVQARSTVGAGDSMVGAFVYAFRQGLEFKECAALAVAASAGAVITEGTKPPDRETVDELLKRVRFDKLTE